MALEPCQPQQQMDVLANISSTPHIASHTTHGQPLAHIVAEADRLLSFGLRLLRVSSAAAVLSASVKSFGFAFTCRTHALWQSLRL
jgi:hypothetical protein